MPGPDFETVVASYYEALFRFAISLTRSEADACDLVQQTFYMWATKGHQLRDPSKVKSWLFTTLHRAFLESRRTLTRFPHTELMETEADLPVILPEAARQLDATQAVEALSRVDEIYRAPVALYYLEDCSYQEIADMLDVPIGTVKSRLARGLAQLKHIFAGLDPVRNKLGAGMNNPEAREILALFRPGTADEQDPSFHEAQQLAKTDPELARWFDEHCEAYLVLRQKFRSIPIPPGLKEQILSERKIERPFFQRYWGPLLAAAAVVALLIGIESSFWPFNGLTDRYSAYRKQMTEMALGNYYMNLMTKDPDLVRNFLKATNAPADYSLPAGLKTATIAGCAAATWQKNPVSMICFKTGRPLPPGEQSDLWLFVAERKNVPNAPPPGAPVLARVHQAATASWSDDNNNYLLAVAGDEAFLQKYLP